MKEIITVTKPATENISKNKIAVTINAASIKPKIARKIVERIIPDDQDQLSLLNVAYARIIKIDEKTNHEIVDIKRPKKSIGTKVLSDSSHSTTFNKIFNENIPHKTKIKLKANQSKLST